MPTENKTELQYIAANLIHTVYFWLKNPNNSADRSAFELAIKKLMTTNPQGVQSHLGCPAATKKRGVVDNSFSYCYVMTFASEEDEIIYQNDPTHLGFIDEASHLWDKVIVYDSKTIIKNK
tara:strand:+ start:375 stop:737 length:363 start_codon:yes stop_codon:yes gene_type:complete